MGLAELADVLWAAQGRTRDGRGVTPSAHALYPLGLTVIAGSVDEVDPGAYAYDPDKHRLELIGTGDHRGTIARTALADSPWLEHAAVLLLLSADLDAADAHFAEQPPRGQRGRRYVWLEAGHAGQNVYLAAAEAGLGAACVAGFDDEQLLALRPALLNQGHRPLTILAVGHPNASQ